jgi:RHS repeat-associated protein
MTGHAARRGIRAAVSSVSRLFRSKIDRSVRPSAIESLEQRQHLTLTATSTVFSHEGTYSNPNPHKVTIVFSADVGSSLIASDLIIDNITTGAQNDRQFRDVFTLAYDAPSKTAVFTYDVDSDSGTVDVLPDGNYACSISKDDVTSSSGTFSSDLKFNFFVLSGDVTGSSPGVRDRTVDSTDLAVVTPNIGLTGKTYSQGNIDYDTAGAVTQPESDFVQNGYGKILGAPATGPTNISLSTLKPGEVTVGWLDGTVGESGWRAQVSYDGTNFEDTSAKSLRHRNVRGNKTTYTFTGLQQGHKYWFRVRAYSDSVSNPHGPNTAYTTKQSIVPMFAKPEVTSLVDVTSPSSQVTVSWKRQDAATEGYEISYYAGSTRLYFDSVSQTSVGTDPSYAFTPPAAVGRYAIRALGDLGNSGYTDFTTPAAPINVRAETVGANFTLHWTDQTAHEDKFQIQRKLATSSTWSDVTEVTLAAGTGSDVSWTDSSTRTANTWYQYRVIPEMTSAPSFTILPSRSADAIYDAAPLPFAPSLDTIATVAQGADGGDPASLDYSEDTGVRYVDGTLRFKATDLVSQGLGTTWGITRSWTNNVGYVGANEVGNGWMIDQRPYLKLLEGTASNPTSILLVLSGSDSIKFTQDSGDPTIYRTSTFRGDTITLDSYEQLDPEDRPSRFEFRLATAGGRIIRFFDFEQASPGLLKQVDGLGVAEYGGSSHEKEVQTFSANKPGDSIDESDNKEIYSFEWEAGPNGTSRIAAIELNRLGGTDPARRVEYSYYDAGEVNGNAGDLKLVEVIDGANGLVIDRSYYRYFKPGEAGGYAGGLKLALDSKSFARMDWNVSNYDEMPDSTIAAYASIRLGYDANHRVASAIVQAKGSTSDDGKATYSYAYGLTVGALVPYTEETRPLGYERVYHNMANRVIFSELVDTATGGSWQTYHAYDGDGRLTMTAEPSAVTSGSGIVTAQPEEEGITGIRDADGLIHHWTYDDSLSSELPGYIVSYELMRGELDADPDTQVSYTYLNYDADATVYGELNTQTTYAGVDGTDERTTRFWLPPQSSRSGGDFADVIAPLETSSSMTTYSPGVATGHHGKGTDPEFEPTAIVTYDTRGRVETEEDQRSVVTRYTYDALYGSIASITRADGTDFESVTTYGEFDSMGRAQKITDPNGNVTWMRYDDLNDAVWTFRGWTEDGGEGFVAGPVEIDREDQARGYTEHVEFIKSNIELAADDGPLLPDVEDPEEIENYIGTSMTALRRDYEEQVGQITESDTYFNLSGIAYKQGQFGLGTTNTHRYATYQDFNAEGALERSQNAVGTITRYTLDIAGHVLSKWIGTGDSPAVGLWNPDESAEPALFTDSTVYYANNMSLVETYAYDENFSGHGDGNLTTLTQYTSPTDTRVTENYYDWRDRLVIQRQAVEDDQDEDEGPSVNRPLTLTEYDNLNNVLASETYDGDLITSVGRTDGVPTLADTDERKSRSEWAFDERGRVYAATVRFVYQEDDSPYDAGDLGGSSQSLVTDYWYDDRDDVIKTRDPRGLVTKVAYDDVRRPIANYITDGYGDSGYGDAESISNDHVLEQTTFDYDANGNVLRKIYRQRSHLSTSTGILSRPSDRLINASDSGSPPTVSSRDAARQTVYRYTYDSLNRVLRSINLGSNDGFGSVYDNGRDLGYAQEMAPLPDRAPIAGLSGTINGNTGATTEKRTLKIFDADLNAFDANYFGGWKIRTSTGQERNIIRSEPLGSGGSNPVTFTYEGSLGTDNSTVSFQLINPYLETSYGYDDAGHNDEVVDPRDIVTKTAHDALGRVSQTTEAYVNGTPSDDDDRITQYAYDGNNNVTMLKAVLPGAHQETRYDYGVGVMDEGVVSLLGDESVDAVFNNDLLGRVRYPDLSTGDASTSSTQREVYTYNSLGQQETYSDRNGTIHTYTYDPVGRLALDAATSLGGDVDDDVRSLGYGYDARGNATFVGSYSDTAGTTEVNHVLREFDGLNHIISEEQADGALSGTVGFEYADGEDGGRLTKMIYPNGRILHYGYDSDTNPATLDDATIGRLSYLADDDGSGDPDTVLEGYEYLGKDTVVVRDHPEADFQWSLAMTRDGGGVDGYTNATGLSVYARNGTDLYTGLDNFGRVGEVRYDQLDGSGDTTGQLDHFRHAYDKAGNRLYRQNVLNPDFDELYGSDGAGADSYDKLNRLIDFQRGALSDTSGDGLVDTVATSSRSQDWSLDPLGNWEELDDSGETSEQERSHNRQNGITSVTRNGSTTTLAYSNNGEVQIDDRGQTYVYDAWGRLVAVDPDGASTTKPATAYTYDGLFRRITEDGDGSGTTIPATHLYYSPQWQAIEERAGTSTTATKQHVWSPVYVDALVLTDRDADADGNFTDIGERVYVLQDANFNVTSLLQLGDHDANSSTPDTWDVVERYSYDTYGLPTVLNADWTEDSLSGDGKSDVANRYLHQGGRYDDTLGLGLFGNRDFLVSLGRWTRQDPGGYVDGMSRFEYVSSSPTTYVDPSGLAQTPGFDTPEAIAERDRRAREENSRNGYDPRPGGDGISKLERAARLLAQYHVLGRIGVRIIDGLEAGIASDWDPTAVAQGVTGIDPSDPTTIVLGVIGRAGRIKGAKTPKGKTSPPPGCFVAGTQVVLGSSAFVDIESVRVGDRLATDGGLSNNGTVAEDANSTEVDPATWRKVSMSLDAGWDVDGDDDLVLIEALVSPDWLARNQADVGVHVAAPLDLEELGIVDDAVARITAIDACPAIADGPGRVVLTTFTRNSPDVYDLTLTNSGESDTLGVTEFHKFYSESRGWVDAAALLPGEVVRGQDEPIVVGSVVRRAAPMERVYNFTVEADHVYYVGDLTATLTHNSCSVDEITHGSERAARRAAEREAGMGKHGSRTSVDEPYNPGSQNPSGPRGTRERTRSDDTGSIVARDDNGHNFPGEPVPPHYNVNHPNGKETRHYYPRDHDPRTNR